MDMPDIPFIRYSPRREIQGPRPTPLKVHKDSHKIRKPPVAPPTTAAVGTQHHYPNTQPRPPVIIYTVSPKIIHANPNEFMSLVQRLTGPNSSSATVISSPAAPSSSYSFQFQDNSGAFSPAARLASIEKTRSPPDVRKTQVVDYEIGSDIQIRTGQFPAGILSPNPNALPSLIPPNFFSPPSDSNPLSFFPDFSPVLHSNRSYLENNFFLPSPSTLFSPQINMPSPNTLHLFNTLFDL